MIERLSSHMKFLTFANFITILRVLLVPPLIYCFYKGVSLNSWEWWLYSLILITICEATDVLDGYLARAMGQVSESGKLLDPLCDSLLRFSVFLSLSNLGIIEQWTVFVFFYRDLTVAYLRILAMSKGVVFAARLSGKLKAIAQGGGLFIILVLQTIEAYKSGSVVEKLHFEVATATSWIMVFICIVTIWSGVDYAYKIYKITTDESPSN